MTGSLAAVAAHAATAPPIAPLAATGVQRGMWLLLAFPLFGAAVLLLGGRRTNRWGHWLGVLMPVAAFGYAVAAYIQMLGFPGDQRHTELRREERQGQGHVFAFAR